MRFTRLSVENFKAINRFEVTDLTDFILIAGPNGCGKSCIFDAIRLLKSVYGGYDLNEWHQWFGEFQIDLNNSEQFRRLFRDETRPVRIAASIALSDPEKEYLRQNINSVVTPTAWSLATGQPINASNFLSIATQFTQHGDTAAEWINRLSTEVLDALNQDEQQLAFTIGTNLGLSIAPNRLMQIIFETYVPQSLGVIEYHSASRIYQREALGGVNLDARQIEAQRKQHTLYNYQQKYSNVKTQLATTYIHDLVASQSGGEAADAGLNDTLKELFQVFFPDKEYLGVQADPNGGLRFPVRTKSGREHDINELSSGEKEILYGYLWLRNSTPKHSTILLDEPELHLNPWLIHGLPDFYHKNLGQARNNQLWLVTHSDALLRQAVGNANYTVFHMTSADASAVDNQAVKVMAQDELERATIDLVGDLAMYRPQGKVVLFEGGGDTETDVRITGRLFPDFAKDVNLISGGSKQRVRDLYEVLAETAEHVGMARRFFAVTDKDSSPWELPSSGAHQLSWDAYHIENYLLEPQYVREAVLALVPNSSLTTDTDVSNALHAAASEVLPGLVIDRLRKLVNDRIVRSINLGADPAQQNAAEALLASVNATFRRLDEARNETDRAFLVAEEASIKQGLQDALADGTWVKEFPGRSILKRFVAQELAGMATYEAFSNLLVDQMVDAGYEPPGMRTIIDIIQADEPLTQQNPNS